MKTTDVLRGLIRACVDDERTLQQEQRLVDAPRARTLGKLVHERARFVADLERLAEGTQRRSNGSLGELLREAGRNVWVMAVGRNNGDAIATCRRSRDRTEARYEAALHEPLPEPIRDVLAAQQRRLHDEADMLTRLLF